MALAAVALMALSLAAEDEPPTKKTKTVEVIVTETVVKGDANADPGNGRGQVAYGLGVSASQFSPIDRAAFIDETGYVRVTETASHLIRPAFVSSYLWTFTKKRQVAIGPMLVLDVDFGSNRVELDSVGFGIMFAFRHGRHDGHEDHDHWFNGLGVGLAYAIDTGSSSLHPKIQDGRKLPEGFAGLQYVKETKASGMVVLTYSFGKQNQ